MKIRNLVFGAICGIIFFSCSESGGGKEVEMDCFVTDLMGKMTIREKLGQLNLPSGGDLVTGSVMNSELSDMIRKEEIGGFFNVKGIKKIYDLQRLAVEETRLKIPLIVGADVIHGYETIFPIPLALSCSWDTLAIQRMARISAIEASADGICWTFSPMVDICRDARWGRIAEGSGEDPYLGSLLAKAYVHGYQGDSMQGKDEILSCVKHFALYGASEAGKDYNTVDMSHLRMYNEYFAPYRAAVEAGVGSVMSSFNIVDGIPATANKWLLTDVLRDEWGFQGLLVTDYNSIAEMSIHGVAPLKEASVRALQAIALIGPMADARNNMCGMWSMTCTPSRHGTLLEGIRSAVGDKAEILYAKGSNVYYDAEMEKGAVGIRPLERGNDQQLLAEALRTAARADVIVAAVGECAEMSGESPSRTNLEIPDAQQDLLKALVKTGKPVVLLLFTGRPLILNWESEHIPSILNVWFGGSETGDAVADVLFGKAVPCGKLTTTFPRSVGQLPLFYNHLNTGRPDPDNRVFNRYASNYLDESNEPLYPFGYGLSYTDFVYGDLQLSSETLPKNGNLTASVTVTNKGNHDGYETVQIYLRDIYAEVARPVKELKGFDRIFLKKGESREVKFVLTEDDLKFYNSGLQYIYEPGEFDVMIGTNSRDVQTKRFIAE